VPAASVATATVKAATTAVKPASAMKPSAATMEAATAVKVASTVEATAVEIAAAIAMIKSTSVPAASVVPAAAIIPTATVTVSASVVAVSVIAVVPGASADEDAACEPIWPVIAVGRASVGIIIVVAISADWRWAVIGRRSKSNAESDVLGARVRSREETNAESNAE
jgi:hypothetical protein